MRADLILLGALLALFIALLPSMPHGDALRWAPAIEAHQAEVNPNYLAMQPVAAAGHAVMSAVGVRASAMRVQQGLDVVAGIATLAIFAGLLRFFGMGSAPRLVLLAACGLSFNFLYLATSDHIKLLVAPFLAAGLYGAVKYARDLAPRHLAITGVWLGIATTFLISSVLCAMAMGLVLMLVGDFPWRERLLRALRFGVPAALIPLAFLGVAWLLVRPEASLPQWITSYGADDGAADAGFRGVTVMTLARAAFAVIKNFVYSAELGPALKGLLGGGGMGGLGLRALLQVAVTALATLTLAGLALGLLARHARFSVESRRILWLALAMALPFALFGLLWDSGEEEFWFQITLPALLLVAVLIRDWQPRWLTVAGVAVVALVCVNNVWSFALPRRLFPFEEYVRQVAEAVTPGSVVIIEGSEPTAMIVGRARARLEQAFTVVNLMTHLQESAFDLPHATAALAEITAPDRHADVYVFGVFDASTAYHPWSLLSERFGIAPAPIQEALRADGRRYRQCRVAGVSMYSSGPGLTTGCPRGSD